MGTSPYDTTTMRRHMYMAAVAEQVETDLDTNGSYNLARLGDPADARVQKDLDRRAAKLVALDRSGDDALNEALATANSGAAWLRSIITAGATMAEIEAHPPGSDALVDSLARHADITDGIVARPVRGQMIPERLLPRMSFKAAELASVNGILPRELIDAVMARVDAVNPDHPMRRLVSHASLFLAMVAASPRDAEDAIAMISAFLGRFRGEEMMIKVAWAAERAADEDELQRCWILQLMTTARFRMSSIDVLVSARPDLLTLVEVTDGVIRPGAATVSVPLRGYQGDARHRGTGPGATRH